MSSPVYLHGDLLFAAFEPTDLTTTPGDALPAAEFDIGYDGSFVQTVIDGEPDADLREPYPTSKTAPRITLGCSHFDGEHIDAASGWDRWSTSVTRARDGLALVVTADQNGRVPVFRVDLHNLAGRYGRDMT